MKKLISYVLSIIMVVGAVIGVSVPVNASEKETEYRTIYDSIKYADDTSWQNDFDYRLDGNYIVLRYYTGSAENLFIPDKATINGTEYTVKLNDDCSNFFNKKKENIWELNNLETISFSDSIDTSNVNNMSNMFRDCSKLTSLDISNFNTKNVIDMSEMFRFCTALTDLDVSTFDTSNVINMSNMFESCRGLINLDVNSFDTSNVTDMTSMFGRCSNLTNLDVSNFDTGNVVSMANMFEGCSSLISIDVSGFDTSKVTSMSCMFDGCSGLASLNLSSFNTSNVEDMIAMFNDCSSLTSLDVSNFDTSKVRSISYIFNNCSNLTSLDVSNFDTSSVDDELYGMECMFCGCRSLTSLDVSNFDTSKVVYFGGMFAGCSNLTSLDVSGFDTRSAITLGGTHGYGAKKLERGLYDNTVKNDYYPRSGMFSDCSKLTIIDVSGFDTGKVEDVQEVFYGCSSLISLDLSKWDMKNLIDNSQYYYYNSDFLTGCTNLDTIETPLNLSVDIDLPATYVKKTDPSIEYTSLPTNQTSSFTIVKNGSSPGKKTPTVTPPKAIPLQTYTGSAITLATAGSTDGGTLYYGLGSETTAPTEWSKSVPTASKVGKYYVWYKVTGDENYKDVDPTYVGTPSEVVSDKTIPTVTPPKANSRQVYTGESMELATAGKTSGGALYYGLGESSTKEPTTWSKNIPTATDVDVYYVWYKVVGDEKYSDVAPTYVGTPSRIIRSGGDSHNVVAIDDEEGTADVRDFVINAIVTVPISVINDGKVYRMYDPFRGEHFYTKSDAEATHLTDIGWNHESNGDFMVVDAFDEEAIPVYRLYNPNGGGMHFYTEDVPEARGLVSQGWKYEGISHYVYERFSNNGYAQYRLYNPYSFNGEHNWTTDNNEWQMLVNEGWVYEGIFWRIN